jgi:hypothetical protein
MILRLFLAKFAFLIVFLSTVCILRAADAQTAVPQVDAKSVYGALQKEGVVKAKFLQGFAVFAQWPKNAAFLKQPHFLVCTFGERQAAFFHEKLVATVFQSKPVKLWHRVGDEPVPECDIALINSNAEQTEMHLAALKDQPTLVIGDIGAEPKDAFALQFVRVGTGTAEQPIEFRAQSAVARARKIELPPNLLKLAREAQ